MISRLARLSLPLDQAIGTSARAYATTPSSKGGKAPAKNTGSRQKVAQASTRGSRGEQGTGDARIDTIRKVLFESDPSDEVRLAALAKVVPSAEVHETITRAWALHLRHTREAHQTDLSNKYNSMRSALAHLESNDKDLFDLAVGGKKFQNVDQTKATNARLDGLMPREMRVPMERPGTNMWDNDWTAPKVAGEEKPAK